MSDLINSISYPTGGSHWEKCFGFVHISNINSRGASKLRVMTNFSLPETSFSKYSESRSQVEQPPACLINLRVSSAASGVGKVMLISVVVFPLLSEKRTVTRKKGGWSSLTPWS